MASIRRQKLIIFFSTGLYAGKMPVAPGTWGALVALPFYWLLSHISFFFQVLALFPLLGISIWLASEASRIMGDKDPSSVVIDEIIGMLIALTGAPFSSFYIIWAFVLFRIFDIFKPFPIKTVEKKMPGGWGIVMDDVLAGIFANIVWRIMANWS
jgi:phosphatidylglycerophosphatase A